MARWFSATLTDDFTTSSASAVDVTGLAFTPAPNLDYEFEGSFLLRTTAVATGPRPGLAWPTGLTDGAANIWCPSSGTATLNAHGNMNASLLIAVGGLPTTTGSYLARIYGLLRAGATPSGSVRVQLASETAATNVTMKAGSFIRWRIK